MAWLIIKKNYFKKVFYLPHALNNSTELTCWNIKNVMNLNAKNKKGGFSIISIVMYYFICKVEKSYVNCKKNDHHFLKIKPAVPICPLGCYKKRNLWFFSWKLLYMWLTSSKNLLQSFIWFGKINIKAIFDFLKRTLKLTVWDQKIANF